MRKTMIAAVVLGLCSVGAWAQNVRPPVTPQPARVTPQLANALVIDYQAQYRKEVEKNKQLRGENDGLRQQLAEMTRHGGSLVHAYCETRTVSRNTAGDRNDCARNAPAWVVAPLERVEPATLADAASVWRPAARDIVPDPTGKRMTQISGYAIFSCSRLSGAGLALRPAAPAR